MSEEQIHVVDMESENMRLDKFLAERITDISRSRLKALIEKKSVLVNGYPQENPAQKVKAGQKIRVDIPEPVEASPQPENIPLDIVFEDEHMLVINKHVGLVVHPGAGNYTGTLVNALLHHCGDSLSGIGGVVRPGIVHRLDKDTSGLMVVAKTDHAHQYLSAQLADRSLSRKYAALVWRAPNVRQGHVDMPIGRHPTNRLKMAVNTRNSREAKTFYSVKETYSDALSLLECRLESGRTHQVRVHMGHINLPLVGDPLYGIQQNAGLSLLRKAGYGEEVQSAVLSFPRQALHASKIGFIHPGTEQEMSFEAKLPDDFSTIISIINQ